MNKTLTVSLLTTTTLALGTVGLLKVAADHAAPVLSVPAPTPVPKPPPAPPAPRAPQVVVLDELHIVGRAARPRAPHPTVPAELVPCSDWRPIGPVYSVREGEQPRERRVRMMCPATR